MCAFAGTMIRFSPAAYLTMKLGSLPPTAAPTVPVGSTKPLVMVPFGAPYHPS
jgi:hypothetical protein